MTARTRTQELARLREAALDEGLPILERARAVIDRMQLVDDILSETLEAETEVTSE